MRRFVLQACDPETGCPVLEARLLVDDLTVLRALLGSRTDVDPDLAMGYPLDGQDIAAFAARFDLPSDWGGRDVLLVPWQRLRELPYLVHTNFELALMLEGRKPLAVFHDALGSEWLEEIVRCFEPFVAQERFTKRVVNRRLADRVDSQTVYFALPDEAWRIEAYQRLMEDPSRSGWTEAMERRLGELLGYEDWQNDYWADWRARLTSDAGPI